jgi:hypothetical protein
MEQKRTPEGDVYAAGRRMSFGMPPDSPEHEEDEAPKRPDDGDEDEPVTVDRTVSDGPVIVQQHVTAGRNAFAVTGDAVIHVRNHD